MAYPQVFAGALLEQRLRRVVPVPVTVIGMDVILARVPAVQGRIGPTLERDFRSGGFSGDYDNAGTGDVIFGAAKDTQRVIAGREFKFGRSAAVKVPVAVIFENTIECARWQRGIFRLRPARRRGP